MALLQRTQRIAADHVGEFADGFRPSIQIRALPAGKTPLLVIDRWFEKPVAN